MQNESESFSVNFAWFLEKSSGSRQKKRIMRLKTTFPGKDLVQVTEETKTSQ